MLENYNRTIFAVQAYIIKPKKQPVGRDYDGQWPEGHRLRDTLLIGDEYVRLDPERLPEGFAKIPKLAKFDDRKTKLTKKQLKALPSAIAAELAAAEMKKKKSD